MCLWCVYVLSLPVLEEHDLLPSIPSIVYLFTGQAVLQYLLFELIFSLSSFHKHICQDMFFHNTYFQESSGFMTEPWHFSSAGYNKCFFPACRISHGLESAVYWNSGGSVRHAVCVCVRHFILFSIHVCLRLMWHHVHDEFSMHEYTSIFYDQISNHDSLSDFILWYTTITGQAH